MVSHALVCHRSIALTIYVAISRQVEARHTGTPAMKRSIRPRNQAISCDTGSGTLRVRFEPTFFFRALHFRSAPIAELSEVTSILAPLALPRGVLPGSNAFIPPKK